MSGSARSNESRPGSSPAVKQPDQPAAEKPAAGRDLNPENAAAPATANGADDDAELSPVPSESMSPPSSLNVNSFGDEIVVGARTNGTRDPSHNEQSTGPAPTDGDETMNDADDSRPPSSRYATRTRATAQNEPAPEHLGRLASAAHESYEALASPRQARRANSDSYEKGVLLGYWRDSPVEDEGYKHAIVATLDTRGRLRPRVQATSISGRLAPSPLPSGPGSTEVGFSRIVFMNHLVGLHHAHIVEYVRFRSALFPADSDEARRQADLAARADADRSVKTNPPAELGPIAYGREIPEDVTHSRPEPSTKRRRTDMGFVPVDRTPLPDPPAAAAPSTAIDLEPLYGSRPTRVMVGYWKGSSEEDPKDRHAILGILGHNDMFRVKVVRETRDGRPVHGNFPTGAGALWVHLEEVVLDDHLKGLERAEIKEYVRIRQFYMDRGEPPENRALNEAVAVANARRRVAAGFKNGPTAGVPEPSLASAGARGDAIIARLTQLYYENGKPPTPAPEMRPGAARRSLGAAAEAERRAAANAELADRHAAAERAAGLEPLPVRGAQARQAASREAAAMAAASAANTHMSVSPLPSQANITHNHGHGHNHAHNHHQNHGHNHAGTPARMRFHETDEMQRLNDIWARQEAQRQRGVAPIAVPSPAAAAPAAAPTPVEGDEVKMHGETRYVRRGAGPFQGRFVADTRALITIDGEDYVEYRVLAKPM